MTPHMKLDEQAGTPSAAKLIHRASGREVMDFDEAEMDMIRRGDMLGPKLGAKVATALETLQRERDEAVSSAAAARANFLTMQNAANELRKERDEAREALKPLAQVLVYSFEDDPGTIHVTYAGETLTVLELDSDKGFAALKLEQDLAKARAALSPKEAEE